MPPAPTPSNDPFEPPPSFAQRVFLGPDGRPRPIVRLILFAIGIFLLSTLVGNFVARWKGAASFWSFLVWQSFFLLAAALLLSWFFLRAFDGRGFRALGLWTTPGWTKQLGIGMALGALLQMGVAILLLATHAIHYTRNGPWNAHFIHLLAANLWLFLLAGAFEEVAFRGYAFQRLIDATSPAAAVIISSTVFGLAHLGNPASSFFSTVNTILAGIVLALPYIRTGKMWTQIGLHWTWNFFLGPIISLPVSGIHFGPTLFAPHLTGPVWWTGGNYGPEGGAVVTVMSLCAIPWILWTLQLNPSSEAPEAVEYRQAGYP